MIRADLPSKPKRGRGGGGGGGGDGRNYSSEVLFATNLNAYKRITIRPSIYERGLYAL